jgi:hypothetical protein
MDELIEASERYTLHEPRALETYEKTKEIARQRVGAA